MHSHPLQQLLLFRLRMFFREPAALFWTYGFPLLLAISLGIAFRTQPPQRVLVDVEDDPGAQRVLDALQDGDGAEQFQVSIRPATEARERLRVGRSSVVIVPRSNGQAYEFVFDPTRPESLAARMQVNDALQRAEGRIDPVPVSDRHVDEPGSRYIDFLLPGLLGMNLMGSGLWGVGFVAVDMRVRKLLKRFSATPMRRSHFLSSMIGARLAFTLPEMVVLLGAGAIFFGVPIRGNWLSIILIVLLGASAFAGIGLLVASRAERIETVAGLMNLVMLPMWLLSGIFFSTEHFPAFMQPIIYALPLTQLNNALRNVILEGASLPGQIVPILFLAATGTVTFALALRWFKWT
ncbi:MAG: ABC transporter permease [Phycisphaerae bacterium]|nr:ABC transporter permease [Phycisphaerae bacterium]